MQGRLALPQRWQLTANPPSIPHRWGMSHLLCYNHPRGVRPMATEGEPSLPSRLKKIEFSAQEKRGKKRPHTDPLFFLRPFSHFSPPRARPPTLSFFEGLPRWYVTNCPRHRCTVAPLHLGVARQIHCAAIDLGVVQRLQRVQRSREQKLKRRRNPSLYFFIQAHQPSLSCGGIKYLTVAPLHRYIKAVIAMDLSATPRATPLFGHRCTVAPPLTTTGGQAHPTRYP